jgi:hypothetical protein
MKMIVTVFFAMTSFIAQASNNCKVFIPTKDYWHAGYTIYFDFENILKEKKMVEVYEQSNADFILLVEGNELEERYFHHAFAKLSLNQKSGKSLEYTDSRRCFTQFCGIADFAKSFNRAYRKLLKNHPVCE